MQRLTKNPALQAEFTNYLKGLSNLRSSGESTLSDYVNSYLTKGRPRAEQEAAAINPIYSGEYQAHLGQLSAAQTAAERAQLDMLRRQIIRQQGSAFLTSDGMGGSYRDRALAGQLAPYYAKTASDEAARNRGDYEEVVRQQLANAGRRQAIEDQALLAPENLRRSLYGQELGYLGTLGDVDRGNMFYGLKYKPSFTEATTNDLRTLVSAY